MSGRDDETIRAAMRHYESSTLVTVDDYVHLPGVAGVEYHGEKRITLYRERGLPLTVLEHLQADVEQRKTLNLIVAWKVDRRQAERRRRSGTAEGFPPIPSDARWA